MKNRYYEVLENPDQTFFAGGSTSKTVSDTIIFTYTKFDTCNPKGNDFHISA